MRERRLFWNYLLNNGVSMFRRVGAMKPEEVFSRTVIGLLLIVTSFFSWGKWAALIIGSLFLISVLSGICLLCELYKLFNPPKS